MERHHRELCHRLVLNFALYCFLNGASSLIARIIISQRDSFAQLTSVSGREGRGAGGDEGEKKTRKEGECECNSSGN
jgi:hypothetical protein